MTTVHTPWSWIELKIEVETSCVICSEPISQADAERLEVVGMIGTLRAIW